MLGSQSAPQPAQVEPTTQLAPYVVNAPPGDGQALKTPKALARAKLALQARRVNLLAPPLLQYARTALRGSFRPLVPPRASLVYLAHTVTYMVPIFAQNAPPAHTRIRAGRRPAKPVQEAGICLLPGQASAPPATLDVTAQPRVETTPQHA